MNLNRSCHHCGYNWPTWVGARCPRCGSQRARLTRALLLTLALLLSGCGDYMLESVEVGFGASYEDGAIARVKLDVCHKEQPACVNEAAYAEETY